MTRMAPTRRGSASTDTPVCGDHRQRSVTHANVVTSPVAALVMTSEPLRVISHDVGSSAAAIPVGPVHGCSTPE
jgi:hypothetical protein